MNGTYNAWLVVTSFVVASLASYVALSLASRVAAARGTRPAGYWLLGGGLGIGLTLVKQLVEMHGGRVGVSSQGAERGSEFVIWLPLAAGSEATPAPVSGTVRARPSASRRVLIVDDDRDLPIP